MEKKRLFLLFICSFLCVIFTLNNLCNKYFDGAIVSKFSKFNHEIVNNCSQDGFLQIPAQIPEENINLILSFVIGVMFFVVFSFASKFKTVLFLLFFIIAYLITYKTYLYLGYTISLVCPIFIIIFSKLFANTYISVFKDNVKKRIETILGKYISKDIKNKILMNNQDAKLGGKRAEITVMFADIRGFTTLSETRKAEDVSILLNEYFTELEPIIAKYNGVINKFIGDAVLVVFGDPEPDKNHAQNAVKCAYEIKDKVKEIRESWIRQGKPKIDIGIGINTGEAFIGNVGSSNRFEYTVIGDTVNIASRLDDYNKIYKTNILISQNTYNKISQIVDVIKISEVSIKGKRKKINIYEILRITE